MKSKKHPKANLENYSKLFIQLGLVLTLGIVYVLIQNKTYNNKLAILKHTGLDISDNLEPIIEYQVEPPKVQPAIKKVNLQDIKKIDDDIDAIESIIDPVDPEAPVEVSKIIDVPLIDDDIIEDVPFVSLENAPVFPGCSGTKDEMKACFTNQISKFIGKKFNAGLASELGLSPGVQRIFVLFKIDNKGDIVEIQARAPHKRLQEEAIRVIELLPKMEPGKQRGKPVNVKYSLPITFMVE